MDGTELPVPDLTVALRHWRVVLAALLMIAIPGFVWQGLFNFYSRSC